MSLILGAITGVLIALFQIPDCADVVMDFSAYPSPVTAQAAYDCLDSSEQAKYTPEMMLASVNTPGPNVVTRLERVGQSNGTRGETLVFFVMDRNGETEWYVAQMGPDGKLEHVD